MGFGSHFASVQFEEQHGMTRLVLAGGFLGAGKTTWLLRAARTLQTRGYRVGYVTNDQGDALVDTALASAAAIPVVEIAGGCFCCRYPELVTALQRLQETVQPDLILAEPVGSCTDLVATVLKPLAILASGEFDLAPLSVMLDTSVPLERFDPTIRYLQAKQLEEADLLLLGKTDVAPASRQQTWTSLLHQRYPDKRILPVSGQSGQGMEEWLALMLGQASFTSPSLDLDYDQYAAAEARLGWLNAQGQIRNSRPADAMAWGQALTGHFCDRMRQRGHELAHLKVWLDAGDRSLRGSQVSLSQPLHWDSASAPWSPVTAWSFRLNLRACAPPADLERWLVSGLEQARSHPDSRYYLTQVEAFNPVAPQPVHRIA